MPLVFKAPCPFAPNTNLTITKYVYHQTYTERLCAIFPKSTGELTSIGQLLPSFCLFLSCSLFEKKEEETTFRRTASQAPYESFCLLATSSRFRGCKRTSAPSQQQVQQQRASETRSLLYCSGKDSRARFGERGPSRTSLVGSSKLARGSSQVRKKPQAVCEKLHSSRSSCQEEGRKSRAKKMKYIFVLSKPETENKLLHSFISL